jgi:hypothetical protein
VWVGCGTVPGDVGVAVDVPGMVPGDVGVSVGVSETDTVEVLVMVIVKVGVAVSGTDVLVCEGVGVTVGVPPVK